MTENDESLWGFYMRQGGRIDMMEDRRNKELRRYLPVKLRKCPWMPVVQDILGSDCKVEYAGCVIGHPEDKDQNWHMDGMHRTHRAHLKADRVMVFVPLIDMTEALGPTEMKLGSHYRLNSSSRFCSRRRAPAEP